MESLLNQLNQGVSENTNVYVHNSVCRHSLTIHWPVLAAIKISIHKHRGCHNALQLDYIKLKLVVITTYNCDHSLL